MVKNRRANKNVSFFLLFFIFLYLRFFLVKRHKTFFGFGFKSFSLDWLYFFFGFGFWLSVRNGLYFVFGFGFFYIFYFNFILANRLASPFIRSSPFYLAPYFIRSPPFIQSLKTKLIFICHPFAPALLLLLLLLLLQVVLVSRRPSIVRTCKMC
jgi:hypothetical protein